MTEIHPGTPEWDHLRNEIIAHEEAATAHTNAARDELLAQGDKFNRIAPMGERGKANGSTALLEQMARECGIKFNTAEQRRLRAHQTLGAQGFRELLRDAPDVLIGYDALGTILADDSPESLLRRLIQDARETGATRITRDAVRRERGMVTGTVGTPQATAERMARDPEFRREVLNSGAGTVRSSGSPNASSTSPLRWGVVGVTPAASALAGRKQAGRAWVALVAATARPVRIQFPAGLAA